MRYTSGNGAKTVGVLPGGFSALLKFFDGQFGRPEDDVLSVIQFPIFCEDAAFGLEPFVERGVWKWRDDGEAWQIDLRVHCKLCCPEEDVRFVVIEAENEATLQRDTVLV